MDLFVPPTGAAVWWLTSRNLARTLQRSKISATTRTRQQREFWIILTLAYLLMFGITMYGQFS
jgi:hypothetical protein